MSVPGRQSTYSRLASNEGAAGHELSTLSPQVADTKSSMQNRESLLSPGSKDSAHREGTEISIDPAPTNRFSGWKVGAVTGASLTTLTLAINIAALVYLKKTDSESLVEVFRGDCKRVENLQIWGHLLINVLSAVLLAASNYNMQVLSAPKRNEVDRAHKKGKWLDIGVQSPRNLRYIAPWRAALWWVLCLSSVPLHLLYNSAFYASTAARSYQIYFMTPEYASYTADQGLPPVEGRARDDAAVAQHIEELVQLPESSERVDRLDPLACLDAYAHVVTTDRSNLIIVTQNETESAKATAVIRDEAYDFGIALTRGGSTYSPYNWICQRSDRMRAHFNEDSDQPCDSWVSKIKADIDNWTPVDFTVDHCLSERVEEQCSFNGNVEILIAVIVCNVIKLVCMLIVGFAMGGHPSLITIGDAISSFLQRPDPATEGRCLFGRKDFDALKTAKADNDGRPAQRKTLIDRTRPATRHVRTWGHAASHTRWGITIGFLVLAVIVVVVFYSIGRSVISRAPGVSLSSIGFGTLHPAAIITGWGIEFWPRPAEQVMISALIANIPQLVFSFLYVNLNSLVTCMWLASEWNDYALERKPLRVSIPSAEQRSTYFLQLPYRVGLPVIAVSGLLHWLISQSLFLAVVAEYNWEAELIDPVSIATCGFSLIPMIVVAVVGGLLCVGTVLLGMFRKLKGEGFMPLAGSCSLAIAAACHAPAGEEKAHLTGVMWGVVADKKRGLENGFQHSIDGGDGGIGHCSFTSGEVAPVQEGRRYA